MNKGSVFDNMPLSPAVKGSVDNSLIHSTHESFANTQKKQANLKATSAVEIISGTP